jgi:hypothetical protein
MHQDGALIIVGSDTTRRAGERVADRTFRARAAELLPGHRDEIGEPPALLSAGWQTAARGGAPYPRGRRAENLVPLLNRERQLVQRAAEPFE